MEDSGLVDKSLLSHHEKSKILSVLGVAILDDLGFHLNFANASSVFYELLDNLSIFKLYNRRGLAIFDNNPNRSKTVDNMSGGPDKIDLLLFSVGICNLAGNNYP